MSWDAIRTALAARLSAVEGVENVHDYIRHMPRKNWKDPEFKAAFLVDNEDGTFYPHTWMIRRKSVPRKPHPENSRIIKVKHVVEIRAVYGLVDSNPSEHDFNLLLDAVAEDLISGDDTLDGAAITMSIPQVGDIGHSMFYTNAFLSHDAIMTLEIEENFSLA